MLLIVMSTSDPEGWTISEYRSFRALGDDDTDSSTDGDSSDDEQLFSKTKTKTIRKKKFKRIQEEELLPE
jgi:hypothetical protein